MFNSKFEVGDTVILTERVKQSYGKVKPYKTTGVITHICYVYDGSCHKSNVYYDVKIGLETYSHIPEYFLSYKDEVYRTMVVLILMIASAVINTALFYLK